MIILKKEKLTKCLQNKILLVFLCFVFISFVSIESINHTIVGLKHVLRVSLLFFLVSNLIKSKVHNKYLVYALVFSLFLVIIMSLTKYFVFGLSLEGRLLGLRGDFSDANAFSLYSIFLIPQVFYLCSINKIFKYFVFPFLLILILAVIVLTSSRASLLVFLVLLIFLFIKSRSKIKVLFVSLCLTIMSLPFIPFRFWNRLSDLFHSGDWSILQRLEIIFIFLKMIIDNLWFGVGIGNSRYRFPEYVVSSNTMIFAKDKVTHNIFLEVMSELGIFGLFTFLYLMYVMFKQTLNKNIEELYYLRLNLIVFLVGGLFLNITYHPLFWILLSTIPALNNINSKR